MIEKGHISPASHSLIVTVVPVVAAADLFTTLARPVDLWVLTGWPAETLAVAYGLLMVAIAVRPAVGAFHSWGAVLAVVVYGGRASGLVAHAVEAKDTSASSAVTGRLLALVLLVAWHVFMAWRAGLQPSNGDSHAPRRA